MSGITITIVRIVSLVSSVINFPNFPNLPYPCTKKATLRGGLSVCLSYDYCVY